MQKHPANFPEILLDFIVEPIVREITQLVKE